MKLHNSIKFQDLDNVDLSGLRLPEVEEKDIMDVPEEEENEV